MSGLFAILFLISLVCLIIALTRPSAFEKLFKIGSRLPLGLGFGFLVLLFLILTSVTAPKTVTLQTANAKATVVESKPKSTVTTKTVTTTQPIAFSTTNEQDTSLAKGSTEIKTQGVNGVETQTYKVTYENGQETNRTLISTVVTTPPVSEVVEDGTYIAPTPKPTPTPAPATPAQTKTPPSSCSPLTNGGNCYEPGEYCRDSDHGATGVAGDGESIVCADNNGWRWEPR